MYHNLRHCRACKSTRLTPVFDLGIQPLANDFRKRDQEQSGYAPLKVLFCEDCTLAQLSVIVKPEILYKNYCYTTSRSETMATHFSDLISYIKESVGTGSAIEIGSNDGYFLDHLRNAGFGTLVGVDPAENLCSQTKARGHGCICDQWNTATALRTHEFIKFPDIIIARHVFCHVHDWDDFIEAVRLVSHRDTAVVIEVPYVVDMLKNNLFDTIYHEHLSYFSLKAMNELLVDAEFHIHSVTRFPVHGGSIVVVLRRDDTTKTPDPTAMAFLKQENVTLEDWKDFSERACTCIFNLAIYLGDRPTGTTIAGFGASAKSTVWLNSPSMIHERDSFSFISDTTPEKVGRYSPGSTVPIVREEEIGQYKPDHLVVFAWNFRDEVLKKLRPYIDSGGKVIIPLPKFEVVGSPAKE